MHSIIYVSSVNAPVKILTMKYVGSYLLKVVNASYSIVPIFS